MSLEPRALALCTRSAPRRPRLGRLLASPSKISCRSHVHLPPLHDRHHIAQRSHVLRRVLPEDHEAGRACQVRRSRSPASRQSAQPRGGSPPSRPSLASALRDRPRPLSRTGRLAPDPPAVRPSPCPSKAPPRCDGRPASERPSDPSCSRSGRRPGERDWTASGRGRLPVRTISSNSASISGLSASTSAGSKPDVA